MTSRPPLFVFDVVTAKCCRDLLVFAADIATSVPCFCCRDCLMMSRPLVLAIDVATARCYRDLLAATLNDVATSLFCS